MRIWRSVLACAAVLVAAQTPAGAGTLPDASVTGTVLFNLGGRDDLAGFGSIALTDDRFGDVGATVSGDPFASIVANAQIGPNNLIPSLYGRGVGALTYYLQIDGPAGSVPVLIDVAGAATALASPGASFVVQSRWNLYDSVALTTELAGDQIDSTQITGSFGQSFDRTVSLTLLTNHVYPIFMLADAEAAATAAGSSAVAGAFVDPFFYFGAGVDPSLYSFSFSEGVGNAAAPEPGLLLLVGTALIALGLSRRLSI